MFRNILGFLFKKKEEAPKVETKEYNCGCGKVKVKRPASNKRKSQGKK
jgi:hypothetical protein